MYPAKGETYIPDLTTPKPEPLSIEEVREHGIIIGVSEDKLTGLVECKKGLIVSYLAVTLTPEGKIDKFVPRPVNRYVRIKKE